MEGHLISLHQAWLVGGPSGPRDNVPGTLGVFSYRGASKPGELCLFVPDSPALLGGKTKVRPGPGAVTQDGNIVRLVFGDGGQSYVWEIGDPITDPAETQAFLDFAETSDRIIHHLLEGARLLGE